MRAKFLCVLILLFSVFSIFILHSHIVIHGECSYSQFSLASVPNSNSLSVPSESHIEEESVFKSSYIYTEEELDLLSRLIFSEGGIESYSTQLKIGSVVMNRVNDPAFPDTIEEVIYQDKQFSVTSVKINGVVMIDRPADEEAKKAAYEILTYGSVLPPEVQVFFHKRITTGWLSSREPYGTFDNTTFAYIYSRRISNDFSVPNLPTL